MAIKQNLSSKFIALRPRFIARGLVKNINLAEDRSSRGFTKRLISRLLNFMGMYHRYSKNPVSIESHYHNRLRVKFINRIKYRNLLISITRFNRLRITALKSYRLRARLNRLLKWVKRFRSSRDFLPRDVIQAKQKRQSGVSYNLRGELPSGWILLVILEYYLEKSIQAIRRNKKIPTKIPYKLLRRRQLSNKICAVSGRGRIWFYFLRRFHKLNVLNRYVSALVKKEFPFNDWLRFKKIHLKRYVKFEYRRARRDLFRGSTRRYLGNVLTIGGVYDRLFSALLYRGLVFRLLKQSGSGIYRKFLICFAKTELFRKIKGKRFREEAPFVNYPQYKINSHIKRIGFIVKQRYLSRHRCIISKALVCFITRFRKNKYRRYLFSFLKGFLLKRRSFTFDNVNFFKAKLKKLHKIALTEFDRNYTCNGFNRLKYPASVATVIRNRTKAVRLILSFSNNYLFNVVSSNIRLLRLMTVVNGINSQLLAIEPGLFPYSQILTSKYLNCVRDLLINSQLKLNHLRFLSNYYRFYSFRIFLKPLIDQAYYTSVNVIESNLNNLSKSLKIEVVAKDLVSTSGDLSAEFNNNITSDLDSNEFKHKLRAISLDIDEIPTTLSYLGDSVQYLREVNVCNLQLAGLLLPALISSGKKKKAVCIFTSLFGLIKFKYRLSYLNEYVRFLSLLRPVLQYRNMYIGGKKYKIPLLLTPQRGYKLAIRWYVNNSTNMGRSVNELFENFNKTLINQGNLLKIRREHHLISFENKSYVRFLRFFKQGF